MSRKSVIIVCLRRSASFGFYMYLLQFVLSLHILYLFWKRNLTFLGWVKSVFAHCCLFWSKSPTALYFYCVIVSKLFAGKKKSCLCLSQVKNVLWNSEEVVEHVKKAFLNRSYSKVIIFSYSTMHAKGKHLLFGAFCCDVWHIRVFSTRHAYRMCMLSAVSFACWLVAWLLLFFWSI